MSDFLICDSAPFPVSPPQTPAQSFKYMLWFQTPSFTFPQLLLPSTLDKCMFVCSLTFWTHINTQLRHKETHTSLLLVCIHLNIKIMASRVEGELFPLGALPVFFSLLYLRVEPPTITISFIFIDMSRRKRHSRELGSISLGLQCF